MRIEQAIDNGNIEIFNHNNSNRNINNRSWYLSNNIQSDNLIRRENLHYNINSNYNTYESRDITEYLENTQTSQPINSRPDDLEQIISKFNNKEVYNKQYRINTHNNINTIISNKIDTQHPDKHILAVITPLENVLDDTNAYSSASPCEEEKAFIPSDTDEMSENGIQNLPRGIVNPNYPGFQHLAHTLQDYSSNIENYYQSENDMTDDDLDVEISEHVYECEINLSNTILDNKNENNNNEKLQGSECVTSQNDIFSKSKILDSHIDNEVPDLIKTVTNNNNNVETSSCDFNCLDTDVENNFNKKDIIGDFNKEIEDEIKQLLNYNICIQDDLRELRNDIKDTFAKPIENTINNISDVVNHVIKKLVETQSDNNEQVEDYVSEHNVVDQILEDSKDMDKENEANIRTEMYRSRPTFLHIQNKTETIVDAHLSDGKDEINIYDSEYDTEKLTIDVETTIKQLSTELRKIIPKLDEMRDREQLWKNNTETRSTVLTDGNSNEVSLGCRSNLSGTSKQALSRGATERKSPIKNDSRASDDRHAEPVPSRDSMKTAHNNTTVHKNSGDCDLGSFDVYNIETALPKLDLDAIENHLRAAKEAERRKRNDREEIRRRLAMGGDNDEYYSMGHTDRPGKKPSLHSRLQNGKNLQICFMNETASDNESQSDLERNSNYNNRSSSRSSTLSKSSYNHPYQTRPLSVNITKQEKINTSQNVPKLRPASISMKTKSRSSHSLGHIELKESDFYALQATLQTEARIALAQAKEMARIQMERERRGRAVSPVTEMLQRSMEKANAPLAPDRRRVSRQLLTDMNIAQLQVIVNELHSQIESLNDSLVKLLMARDELHMGQDSMLVDIEDLTRYLGVKEQTKKNKGTTKSGVRRLTSLVHK